MDDALQETLEEIAESENKLVLLKALRRKLCRTLDTCESGRDIAALSNRLIDVIAAIKEAEAEDKHDEIDEIIAEHNPVRPRKC